MGTLDENYTYCADEVRKGDPQRFHSALFARGSERASLMALYAFNLELIRAVTITREVMLGAIRLQWWREVMEELFAGHGREHPVVHALRDTIWHKELPRAPFDAMIDARMSELDDAGFATRDEFAHYGQEAEGSLFALAARTLSPERAGDFDAGASLAGEAYAGVATLRSVAAQASRKRVLIPQDILREAGTDTSAVLAARSGDATRGAVARVVADAGLALDRACRAIATQHVGKALPAFLPLAPIRGELRRAEGADDFFVLARRDTPLFVQQWRLLIAALRGAI